MRIPVKIYPAYWIFTGILSFLLAQGNIVQALIWMGIIFVSVLFHECGHAYTARLFGRAPRIELVAMGGVTYHDGDKLPFWKQFLITLDGPLFGFILGIAAWFCHSLIKWPLLLQVSMVNLFWTIVNLVPVLPLDGGQLLRIGLEKWFGYKGLRYTFCTSGLFALLCSLIFFVTNNILAGAIFFLFAFENFTNFRKSRHMSQTDRQDELKMAFAEGEQLLQQGKKHEALLTFQKIRSQTGRGMLYAGATQYAAVLLEEEGKSDEAHALLKTVQESLEPPALLLLHRLAFERRDDLTTSSLGASVFQLYPLAEVALRNAYAAARLKQLEAALGWLKTAEQSGAENLADIVKESDFDALRHDPAFQDFIKTHS